jgi:hypothetical protein
MAGASLLATAAIRPCRLIAKEADTTVTKEAFGFPTYDNLLATLKQRGHRTRVLGYAPDRSPVVAVKGGGTKKPAIFISAGSHSTEHAGVVAAVDLIGELETAHELYVIPCRDPIGLSGYRHALGLSLGSAPEIQSVAEAEKLLREKGDILYDNDGRLLVSIGEYGYANQSFYRKVEKGASFLEPLKGRRIYFPSNYDDAPGAAPLQRAYTQIVTPEGEVLHLNRFHDTPWAPVEVQCTRRLMAEIQPRLVFDLHEYGGDDFWMSARRQQTDEDEVWELRMAREAAQAVAATGASFPDEDYRPGSFFDKLEEGVFWLDATQRGEGLNLVDFAARKYGPGFTIETGMRQKWEDRLMMQKTVVQTAVKIFEDRYR